MNMATFLPSLPRMTIYFNTEYSVMQLSVSLYLAATAVLQLIIGPLSDRYGRRPVVLVCLVIFILATLGCLFATTIEVFLAFRMLQGAVAVGLVLSRAIVRDMVPQSEAASMIGYVTMGMALVPMVGPMIGGALDQVFGWQSTFIFLTLCGIGVLALCYFDQGETASGDGKSFAAQVRDYPELLASRRFWGYVLSAAFASGAFFAFLGGAPLVASDVYGLNAFWAGIGFGTTAIGYAIGNFISGRYSTQYGINAMIQVGALITTAGMVAAFAISLAGFGSAIMFFGFCTFVGLGNGLVMPNASAGMLSVRPHLAGTASGLGSSILIGGGAALSAFAGVALGWGGGDTPLLAIMAISALLGYISIRLVVAREKRLAGALLPD